MSFLINDKDIPEPMPWIPAAEKVIFTGGEILLVARSTFDDPARWQDPVIHTVRVVLNKNGPPRFIDNYAGKTMELDWDSIDYFIPFYILSIGLPGGHPAPLKTMERAEIIPVETTEEDREWRADIFSVMDKEARAALAAEFIESRNHAISQLHREITQMQMDFTAANRAADGPVG